MNEELRRREMITGFTEIQGDLSNTHVIIANSDYSRLREAEAFLAFLHAAGVNKWKNYDQTRLDFLTVYHRDKE
jgi:hypothetical protein